MSCRVTDQAVGMGERRCHRGIIRVAVMNAFDPPRDLGRVATRLEIRIVEEVCDEVAARIYNKLNWVGDILFVDLTKPENVRFVREEIVKQACWKSKRKIRITDNEFTNRFPIHDDLPQEKRRDVEAFIHKITEAGQVALAVLSEQVQIRNLQSLGGGDRDVFGQRVDLIFQFLDNMWDGVTEKALEKVTGNERSTLV